MRRVLLIHGINSNGKWRKDVARVLRAHFEPIPIKYWHYRWLGATKLLLEPWALILLALLSYFFVARYLPTWIALALGLGVGITLAILASPLRRRWALESVVRQASPSLSFGRPHIIAHSFGTYLTIWALKTIAAVRARRVVLVGCVVSAGFDWKGLKEGKAEVYEAIRNDWTNQDQVVRLGRLLEWRIPDFGRAGLTGFTPLVSWVHSVTSPYSACPSCSGPDDVPIHNFDCSGLGHSDSFLGGAHAARFWLPFLWGFDAAEFGELLDCCESASELLANGHLQKLKVVEDELEDSEWKWAGGKLVDYMGDTLWRTILSWVAVIPTRL
jgi:pimeloyl-ACP methyl ester carboxylesterase